MKGTVKSFRRALREAFEDVLQKKEKAEALDPTSCGLEPEEESASRERQQASGYLGAFDGSPEYGDDLPWPNMDGGGDDVAEEGISQTKRSAHGYQLEDPVDYDLPGEPVKEAFNFEVEDEDDDEEEPEKEEKEDSDDSEEDEDAESDEKESEEPEKDVEEEGMFGSDDDQHEDPMTQHMGSHRMRTTGTNKSPIDDMDRDDDLTSLMKQLQGTPTSTKTPSGHGGHFDPNDIWGKDLEPDVHNAVTQAKQSGKPVIDPKTGKADFTTDPKTMSMLKALGVKPGQYKTKPQPPMGSLRRPFTTKK